MSSLAGHANLLCIVPSLSDVSDGTTSGQWTANEKEEMKSDDMGDVWAPISVGRYPSRFQSHSCSIFREVAMCILDVLYVFLARNVSFP